jgi:hypothetical protein
MYKEDGHFDFAEAQHAKYFYFSWIQPQTIADNKDTDTDETEAINMKFYSS